MQVDKTIAETKRLILSQLSASDHAFILELVNSPSWLKYIGNRNIKTKTAAKKYIQEGPEKSYVEQEFGLYKISLKETGQPIGVCGLIKRPELDLPDLGYALLEGYHGHGYVTESSEFILQRAQRIHKMDKLLAIVSKRNVKSIAVLEKLGFVYQHKRSAKLDSDSLIFMKTFIRD